MQHNLRLPDLTTPLPDYGMVNLQLHRDQDREWLEVQSTDDVIGVSKDILGRLTADGQLVDGRLTLDTADEYAYERIEDSQVHPHTARFRLLQRP